MTTKPPPPPLRSAKRLTAPPGAAERRQFLRYELVAQMQLRKGGELHILDVVNVSLGGLLVSLEPGDDPGVVVGDVVSVFIDIGDDETGKPISVDTDAEVVRIVPGNAAGRSPSIAMRWTSGDAHARSRLEALITHVSSIAVD